MAGRRRSDAGETAAANVASAFLLDARNRRQSQEDDYRKFQHRLVELGLQGKVPGVEANPDAMQSMLTGQGAPGPLLRPAAPSSQLGGMTDQHEDLPEGTTITQTIKTPQGTITIKRGGAKTGDPALHANRVALLQSRIQGLEQENALAPMLAEGERQKRFPESQLGILKPGPGLFGGFSDRPTGFQKFFGVQQRPALEKVPQVDTGYLRGQLQALQGSPQGGQGSVPQDEVADLMEGIQRGVIQTRQDAEALIEQAGYDPSDPAFQAILNQLP